MQLSNICIYLIFAFIRYLHLSNTCIYPIFHPIFESIQTFSAGPPHSLVFSLPSLSSTSASPYYLCYWLCFQYGSRSFMELEFHIKKFILWHSLCQQILPRERFHKKKIKVQSALFLTDFPPTCEKQWKSPNSVEKLFPQKIGLLRGCFWVAVKKSTNSVGK